MAATDLTYPFMIYLAMAESPDMKRQRPNHLTSPRGSTTVEPDYLSRRVTRHRRFHLPVGERAGSCTVISAGWERCDRDYRMERSTFPWLGIEIVATGNGTIELAGVRHPLSPGTVFSYGPGVPHRITVDPASLPVKYFVDVDGAAAARLLADSGLSPGSVRQTGRLDEVIRLADTLIDAGMRHQPTIAALLAEALVRTLGGSWESTTESGGAHATYLRCRRIIDEADGALRTVAAAAQAGDVTPEHLSRLFRRHAGTSPAAYLRLISLRRAPDLLRQPGASVAAVADDLGYRTPFHFSRCFRRAYGIPPSRLRGLDGASA